MRFIITIKLYQAFASLEAAKIHWSSALSGKGSKYGTIRTKSMAPGSFAPQGGEECAGLRLKEIPTKIAEHYSLNSDPILHTLPNLMAKPLCLHAARLGPANRQALERLAPKLLQILLHAESPALLFY